MLEEYERYKKPRIDVIESKENQLIQIFSLF
jgi:hypothetical protein